MLCLLERPSQPVNFGIASEDETSLMLTWNEPTNIKGEVNYYIVSISYVLFAIVCKCIASYVLFLHTVTM